MADGLERKDYVVAGTEKVENFVAVYGGSFDPPHLGHVMVVSHLLLNDPRVERILVVPCFQQQGKNLTRYASRFMMCRQAFGWLPKVEVWDIEFQLGGESETLRTMKAIKQEYPDWNLRFVMGTDLLATCKTWDGWDELEKISPPLPIGRAGIAPLKPGDPTPIAPIVSSTIVRSALAAGDYGAASRYLPSAVLEYIRELKLYEGRP